MERRFQPQPSATTQITVADHPREDSSFCSSAYKALAAIFSCFSHSRNRTQARTQLNHRQINVPASTDRHTRVQSERTRSSGMFRWGQICLGCDWVFSENWVAPPLKWWLDQIEKIGWFHRLHKLAWRSYTISWNRVGMCSRDQGTHKRA